MSTGVHFENFSCFFDSLVFLLGWFLHLNHLHLAEEFQAQVVNQGLNLAGYFRRDVLLDVQEGPAVALAVGATGPQPFAQQPVGDVYLGLEVLRGGIAL